MLFPTKTSKSFLRVSDSKSQVCDTSVASKQTSFELLRMVCMIFFELLGMDCVSSFELLGMDCVIFFELLGMDCVTFFELLGMDCVKFFELLGMDCATFCGLLGMDCVTFFELLGMDCVTSFELLGWIAWHSLSCLEWIAWGELRTSALEANTTGDFKSWSHTPDSWHHPANPWPYPSIFRYHSFDPLFNIYFVTTSYKPLQWSLTCKAYNKDWPDNQLLAYIATDRNVHLWQYLIRALFSSSY